MVGTTHCETTCHVPLSDNIRCRYVAKIGALTAQNAELAAANTELTTKISALAAENSKLAAQCGAVVDATREASLQEGNAHAHARTPSPPVST